jgi:tetratricopeptide (TPR) repeat protein
MGTKKPQKSAAMGGAGGGKSPGRSHPRNLLEAISAPPLSFLLIAAAIFAVYLPTLTYDFTWFDDDLIIVNNLEWYREIGNVGAAFTRDAFNDDVGHAFYRPMQHLSFFADVLIWGRRPGGFRATNLLLHVLTCICILTLFRLLKLDAELSFLATLLFSVHPLFSHAVIWIPARGDLLIGCFGTLSYVTLLQYLQSRRALFLTLHVATLCAAMFSKETAMLLPLLFAVHMILFEPMSKWQLRHAWLPASWILSAAAYLVCRSQVIWTAPKADEFGLGPLAGNLPTIPEFLSKFILPWNLAVLPVFSTATTLLGVLFLMLLGWHIHRRFRAGGKICVLGLIWFLLFTAITMLYRHKLGKAAYDYLEHRAYLPMIGILMALVGSAYGMAAKWEWRKLLFPVTGVALILSVLTIVHGREFRDPLAFYAAAIRSNPAGAMAYYNRAKYRQMLGDKEGAMTDYDNAIRVKPDCADAYNNRGNARRSSGDLQGALLDYGEAIRWDRGFSLAFFNRGNVRLDLGDQEGAAADYTQAIALDPAYAKAWNNRGTIFYRLGKLDLASADFDRALQINPRFADAWRNRGSVRFRNKDVRGACGDWEKGGRAGNKEAAALYQQYCR